MDTILVLAKENEFALKKKILKTIRDGLSLECMCKDCDLSIAVVLYDEKRNEVLVWTGSCLSDTSRVILLTNIDGKILYNS